MTTTTTTTDWYELEGEDAAGCWDASNVTWNPDATRFDTLADAKAEIEYWLGEGRDVTTLRVVRVSPTGREVVYQPPVGEWYKWDTERCGNHNVSVNDGVLTYYSVWYDDDGKIDLRDVADSFADGYDHNGEPGQVSITVTNLITGEELEDEMIWEDEADDDDDEDADDDDDDGDEDADDDAIAALWHGEIDFLDCYQSPGRRGR